MVRPVEADLPAPAGGRRTGVRSATQTPEQLGQTPVQGQAGPPSRRKTRSSGPERRADSVSLAHEPEAAPNVPGNAAQRTKQDPAGRPKVGKHLDVRG